MRFDGIVKSWQDERGFGFIEPAKGGQELVRPYQGISLCLWQAYRRYKGHF